MTTLRWTWSLRGAHVHVRLFVASEHDRTGTMAGSLVFRSEEWAAVCESIAGEPAAVTHELVAETV